MVIVSTFTGRGAERSHGVHVGAPAARSRPEKTGRDEAVAHVMMSAPVTAAFRLVST
jgi:hypothetical protein